MITAKIHRRLRKLSGTGYPALPNAVMASIEHTLNASLESLAKHWDWIQQIESLDLQLPTLSTLDFDRDTLVALPALDNYIEATHKRRRGSISFRFMPSSHLIKYKPGVLPRLSSSDFDDPLYAVANLDQFEQWVAYYIDNWVDTKARDNACDMLYGVIVQYHTNAIDRYSGNPEAISVMVLIMFELWVVYDKAALQRCPWLSEYDPGIPINALQNLLLLFLNQMKRFFALENYIESRRAKRIRLIYLLFAVDGGNTFASKYFDQLDIYLALMSKIVSYAEATRQEKKREFQLVKADYRHLDTLYKETEHKYTTKVIDTWCDPPETE